MASNNYAEVITDSTKAQWVVAELESMAAQGSGFKRAEPGRLDTDSVQT